MTTEPNDPRAGLVSTVVETKRANLDREPVARRALVPTPRERDDADAEGARDHDHAPSPHQSRRRPSIRASVASWARDADPRKIAGPKLPLIVFCSLALFSGWDEAALQILLPEMRTDFAFDLRFMLVIGSLVQVSTVLMSLPMGYLADRIKRVRMVQVSTVFGNASSIWTATSGGVGSLMGSRMLAGFSGAAGGPATFPLLADYYPVAARMRAFSLIYVASGIGGVVGPAVAGSLAYAYGWRWSVGALGMLAVLVSLSTLLLKEPKRGYWDRMALGADDEVAAREQRPIAWGEAWRAAWSIRTIRRLWFATPFLMIGQFISTVYLTIYFTDVHHLGPQARGYIGAIAGVAGVVWLILAAPAVDRMLQVKPARVLTLYGALIISQVFVFTVLALVPPLWVAILLSLPLALFSAILLPGTLGLLSLLVPARMRGLGLQMVAPFTLAGMIATPLYISAFAELLGTARALLTAIPPMVAGGTIVMSAALYVQRDIRAGLAASLAEEEAQRARTTGRAKMLVCRDVDVTYNGVQVLFNVDFDVEEGETVALLGTNGAGKSTLLRAIAGVQEASNGAIFLDGEDITHLHAFKSAARGVVMVPGGHGVFTTLTVEENLQAATWVHGTEASGGRLDQALDLFPVLRERLHEQAGNLSGGEQQMVALAQAFIMKPRLLMIDELSLGLAPGVVEQLVDVLHRIHRQGTTVIIVEQSLSLATRLARRAVFMEKGEIRFDGPTEELLRRPDLVRSVFLGGAGVRGSATPLQKTLNEREVVLEARAIEVSFGGVRAVNGVNLSVRAGEIVGLIGPNGAGKTTLFDILSGFVKPDAGAVLLGAADVTALTPDGRALLGLGRTFQHAHLFPSITVRDNIALARQRHGGITNPVLTATWAPQVRRSERRIMRRADALIDAFGLQAYADKFPSELSTGTRRAVEIACVTGWEPKVLLLDEPSSGLAQGETDELGPMLARLARTLDCALVLIEHDMALVSSIADRMFALELGSIVAEGTPEQVLSDPAVIASYLSASADLVGSESGDDIAGIVMSTLDDPPTATAVPSGSQEAR